MSRNLDTAEEKFLMRVMTVALSDPKVAQMAYRLSNGTMRSELSNEDANRLRLILKSLTKDLKNLKLSEEE